jgi:hypothetical protein
LISCPDSDAFVMNEVAKRFNGKVVVSKNKKDNDINVLPIAD